MLPVRRRQLARELRLLRAADGRTGEEIATALGWSSAKVSRIETAKTAITPADLRRLLGLYQATEEQVERLLILAHTARERGWWDAYSDVAADYRTLIGLEAVDRVTSGSASYAGIYQPHMQDSPRICQVFHLAHVLRRIGGKPNLPPLLDLWCYKENAANLPFRKGGQCTNRV